MVIIIFNGRLIGFVWKCSSPCKLGLLFVLKCKQLCWFIEGILEALSFLFVLSFLPWVATPSNLSRYSLAWGFHYNIKCKGSDTLVKNSVLIIYMFPSQHWHSFCSWLTWFKIFLPNNNPLNAIQDSLQSYVFFISFVQDVTQGFNNSLS